MQKQNRSSAIFHSSVTDRQTDRQSLLSRCYGAPKKGLMCSRVGAGRTYVSTHFRIFSRGHATLHLAVSVGRSLDRSHFLIPRGFGITALAQPSATGLPCIGPCFMRHCPDSKFLQLILTLTFNLTPPAHDPIFYTNCLLYPPTLNVPPQWNP